METLVDRLMASGNATQLTAGADVSPKTVGADTPILTAGAQTLNRQAFGSAGDGARQDGNLEHVEGE